MANEPGKKSAANTRKHVARLQREQQQSRIILYAFIGILAAVVLLLLYGYLDIKYFQLQRPVAKVGETEILASQFEPRVRVQRRELLRQYEQFAQYGQLLGMEQVEAQLQQIQSQLNAPTIIGQGVLDQMINEELIRQEAKKRGITVSEEELNEAMQDAFGFYPNGSPTPSPTPTQLALLEVSEEAIAILSLTPTATATPENTSTPEFAVTAATTLTTGTPGADAPLEPSFTPTATLEPTASPTVSPTAGPSATPLPTATPYTLEGFQSEFKNARDTLIKLGFTEADYRKLFEIQILERKLREVIVVDAIPAEEQVWARHILVSDEVVAKDIIKRLKNGENFGVLAMTFSTDTGSAVKGGDLGWFGKGAMVPEFEAAVYALEKSGDFTTEPIKSEFGYHIIQLIDRPYSPDQIEAAKDQAFTEWLTAAREEYGVEIFDFWKERTPSEPNFSTMATDSVKAVTETAKAESEATDEPTATP